MIRNSTFLSLLLIGTLLQPVTFAATVTQTCLVSDTCRTEFRGQRKHIVIVTNFKMGDHILCRFRVFGRQSDKIVIESINHIDPLLSYTLTPENSEINSSELLIDATLATLEDLTITLSFFSKRFVWQENLMTTQCLKI